MKKYTDYKEFQKTLDDGVENEILYTGYLVVSTERRNGNLGDSFEVLATESLQDALNAAHREREHDVNNRYFVEIQTNITVDSCGCMCCDTIGIED